MIKRIGIAFFALTMLVTMSMPSYAHLDLAGSSNLNNQIAAAGEDLDSANAQVAAAMKKWRKAAAALPAAQYALKQARAALAKATSSDAKASAELTKATNLTKKAVTNLGKTKTTLSAQQIEVGQLIRAVYRQGPMSELAVVMGSDTPMDLTARLQTLSSWHASKTALIASLVKSREDLSLQTKQLKALKATKLTRKQAAAAKVAEAKAAAKIANAAQAKVNKIVAQQASALKAALKQRNVVKKRYLALKKEQARLKAQAHHAGGIGKDLHGNNDLLWPIKGAKVTQFTGLRIHPVYGYRSCHTGIDLGAAYGTPIHAAEDGIVAAVEHGGPYGRYTLIAHGDGLTTFYAHQSRQVVQDGDAVLRGEVIGYVGSTGWSTGPHLHFEVRVDGTPYNPMGWFGGKKSKVSCVD